MTEVAILCGKRLTPSEDRARKIADFVGAQVVVVPVAEARDIESIKRQVPQCEALIVHVNRLVDLAGLLDAGAASLTALIDMTSHLFVYGFARDSHASVLQVLSAGRLRRVERLPDRETAFDVQRTQGGWCDEFGGLRVGTADATRDARFVDGVPHAGKTVLIRVGESPFFVCLDHEGSHVYLVACSELGDLDEEVSHKAGLVPGFSRLVPVLSFLRAALKDRIWHSERAQASVIIDDPLLTQRYGFLAYQDLVKSIGARKFSASIGFIPWNYRRTRKQVAELFRKTPPTLSLCVHGCDHTKGEFADESFDVLFGRAQLALARMQQHSRLSGVPFDDIMVFPQGLFSSEALSALEACGYLAAVNTELCPVRRPQVLPLRHLLDVAVTAFGDLPLFGRHYPRDLAEFAFDLFLGKPALVVEHHGYFRRGYEELSSFVERLNSLDQRLEWGTLSAICSQACLKKVTARGDVEVKFYTSRFRLDNRGTKYQTYTLKRRLTVGKILPSVTVNGRPWEQERSGDYLVLKLALDPGKTADVKLTNGTAAAPATIVPWKRSLRYQARVFARRFLCEVRDNYVDTFPVVSKVLWKARTEVTDSAGQRLPRV